MLLLDTQNLTNGKHFVEVSGKADGDQSNKYFEDTILVEGLLRVYNNRLILKGTAKSSAKLICDISLEEFKEVITAEINITIFKGIKAESRTETDENTLYIAEEEKKVDITEIVMQELLVNIPMKKVAPKYRGKDIDDIYPQIKQNEKKGQSPFDILKNLKNN